MAVAQIQDNKIEIPKNILHQLRLVDGQRVEIEVVADNQLNIKPAYRMGAKERLKEILNKGFHMGRVYDLDREAIYDEVD